MDMLALAWYHLTFGLGLVGVVVFYIMYRKAENQ